MKTDIQMNTPNQPAPGKLIFLVFPIILYLVMGAVFTVAVRWFGKDMGYLLGFACYWLVFGLAIPAQLAGRDRFASLLKDQAPLFSRQNWMAALLWVIVMLVALGMYAGKFVAAPLPLILLAIPSAIINGFCEEIFWRGVFVKTFPGNPWLAVIYPAVGFALWHFIPQSIYPAENVFGFVLSTLFLGLVYGFIAYRTGSAKWTAISHGLNGILAVGGALAPTILKLLFKG
ncbi:MAG: CPBP family intramembrane glutamic endopeptidase [Anaerolineales bacterium]